MSGMLFVSLIIIIICQLVILWRYRDKKYFRSGFSYYRCLAEIKKENLSTGVLLIALFVTSNAILLAMLIIYYMGV